jgi:hypothetical protein
MKNAKHAMKNEERGRCPVFDHFAFFIACFAFFILSSAFAPRGGTWSLK